MKPELIPQRAETSWDDPDPAPVFKAPAQAPAPAKKAPASLEGVGFKILNFSSKSSSSKNDEKKAESAPAKQNVKSTKDLEWEAFEANVKAAWKAYVDSGYWSGLRGVNNDGEFHIGSTAKERLSAIKIGSSIKIGDGWYKKSSSDHAGVSLKREDVPSWAYAFIVHL